MKPLAIALATCALVALTLPGTSQAAPSRPGPYVSGFIGVAIPSDTNSTGPGISDRIEFDPGVNVGGALGYDTGYLRLEGEVSYKHGEMRAVNDFVGQTRYVDLDGRIGALAMMGNVFVDMHNDSPITPYLGGGIGFAALMQSNTFGTDINNPGGGSVRLYRSDSDAVFAYQAGGGLGLALTRKMTLDLGYRYFQTSEATFNRDTTAENRLKFESHNVSVGIRVKF